MNISELATALPLGEPKLVQTRNGPKVLRKAPAPATWWDIWRANKPALQKAGWSCAKNTRTGSWEVCLWQDPDAEEQGRQIAASRAASVQDDAAGTTSTIGQVPVPAGLAYLPYQLAGIQYALGREGCLIADEMGLGKTIQAIGVINATSPRKVLIVCPASLKRNWRDELGRWLTGSYQTVVIDNGSDTLPLSNGQQIVIVNYDLLSRQVGEAIRGAGWDLLIADEAHYLKNGKALRTKMVLGHWAKQPADRIDPIRARRRLFLTGTPITNRPIEAYTLLKALDPASWGNWMAYATRYCNGHRTRFGWDVSGASNLGELQTRLRSTIMVRRLKKDVLTDLPAKVRQIITIEPDAETRKVVEAEARAFDAYRQDIDAAQAALDEAEVGSEAYNAAAARLRAAVKIAFENMARVRVETARRKIPAVIEHLLNIGEDQQTVVFAHHHEVIDAIVDALRDELGDGSVVSLTGRDSQEARHNAVTRFQTDPAIRFFVGNIAAAGVGLTLTASSHVVFAELDWVPGNVSQAEDRCHRIGQKDSVLVQHLVIDGSIDARMVKTIVAKQHVIDAALDNEVAAPKQEPAPDAKLVEAAPKAEAEVEALPEEQVLAIHTGLRILAGMDKDGARVLNGVGFNKLDTEFGRGLAARDWLSPKQAIYGRKLVNKYRRQLPEELVKIATGGAGA